MNVFTQNWKCIELTRVFIHKTICTNHTHASYRLDACIGYRYWQQTNKKVSSAWIRCPIKITQHVEFPREICISVYSAKLNIVFLVLVLFKARIQDYVHHQQQIEFQQISAFSKDSVHHFSADMSWTSCFFSMNMNHLTFPYIHHVLQSSHYSTGAPICRLFYLFPYILYYYRSLHYTMKSTKWMTFSNTLQVETWIPMLLTVMSPFLI